MPYTAVLASAVANKRIDSSRLDQEENNIRRGRKIRASIYLTRSSRRLRCSAEDSGSVSEAPESSRRRYLYRCDRSVRLCRRRQAG